MLKRLWAAIKDGFAPHPELFEDAEATMMTAATMEAPTMAPPLQAAALVTHQDGGGS